MICSFNGGGIQASGTDERKLRRDDADQRFEMPSPSPPAENSGNLTAFLKENTRKYRLEKQQHYSCDNVQVLHAFDQKYRQNIMI